MGARIDREPRQCAPPAARRRPAVRGGPVRHAEAHTRAVVDHMLGAKPLTHRQPVAEGDGRAVHEDRRRHVLGVSADIGAHILLLVWGGRQNPLGDRLEARLGPAL